MVKYIPIIKQYIAREDVINTIAFYREDPDGVDHALQSIMNIPATDVQPVKHGEWLDLWIEDDEMTDGGFMVNQCSVCKDEMYYGRPNYCPNCGARMDGAE